MENQALKNVPKTEEAVRRQKGPIPLNAIFLCLGLLAVLFLFFGLPLIETLVND